METISTILCFIGPGLFIAKLDISDCIPISGKDQAVLKFKHKTTLYKFAADTWVYRRA